MNQRMRSTRNTKKNQITGDKNMKKSVIGIVLLPVAGCSGAPRVALPAE